MTRKYSAIYLLCYLPSEVRASRVQGASATLVESLKADKCAIKVSAPHRDKTKRVTARLSSVAALTDLLPALVEEDRDVDLTLSWPRITPTAPPDFGMYLSLLPATRRVEENRISHFASIGVAVDIASARGAQMRSVYGEVFAALGGRLAHMEDETTWDVRQPFLNGVTVSDDMCIRAAGLLSGLSVAKKLLPSVIEPTRGDLLLDAASAARLPAGTPTQPLPDGGAAVFQKDLSDSVLRALDTDERAGAAQAIRPPMLKQAPLLSAPAVSAAARDSNRHPVKYDDASWYEDRGDFGHATIGAVLGWLAVRGRLSEEGREALGSSANVRSSDTPASLSRGVDGRLVSDMVTPEANGFLRAYLGPGATPSFRKDVDLLILPRPERDYDSASTLHDISELLDRRWQEWKAKH